MTKKPTRKKPTAKSGKDVIKPIVPDAMNEGQTGTGTSLVRRGMSASSITMIERMRIIAEATQPITGRGVGYKMFVQGLIASMGEMRRVYRLLLKAREDGIIPWEWVVDETRAIERVPTWADPAEYARCVAQSYRRDFWDQQPHRVQVWSEKGTVRGVLQPVLDQYAVGFNPVHGFNSATDTRNAADDDDGRPLIILYVGDFDPSGMFMSEVDLPKRFAKYGGDHIKIIRIALTKAQTRGLPSFPAADKAKDPRYKWFVANTASGAGNWTRWTRTICATASSAEIKKLIEPDAWKRCEVVNAAERASLRDINTRAVSFD